MGKAKAILDLYNQRKQTIAELTRSPHLFEVLDFLFKRPIFQGSEFVETLPLPSTTAKRVLGKLLDAGLLVTLRETSGRRPATLMFKELVSIAEGKEITEAGYYGVL